MHQLSLPMPTEEDLPLGDPGSASLESILQADDTARLADQIGQGMLLGVNEDHNLLELCARHNSLNCAELLIRAGLPPPSSTYTDYMNKAIVEGDRIELVSLLDRLGIELTSGLFIDAREANRFRLAARLAELGAPTAGWSTRFGTPWDAFRELYQTGLFNVRYSPLELSLLSDRDLRRAGWLALEYQTRQRQSQKPVPREVSEVIRRFSDSVARDSEDYRIIAAHRALIEKDTKKRQKLFEAVFHGAKDAADVAVDVCVTRNLGGEWATDMVTAGLPLTYRVLGRGTVSDYSVTREDHEGLAVFLRHGMGISTNQMIDGRAASRCDLRTAKFEISADPRMPLLALLATNVENLDTAIINQPSAVHQISRDTRNCLMYPMSSKKLTRLLEAGADVRYRDRRGRTALHYLVEATFNTSKWDYASQNFPTSWEAMLEVVPLKVALLLDAGADPLVVDLTGRTALDLIPKMSHDDAARVQLAVSELLERAMRQRQISSALAASASPAGRRCIPDII